MATTTVSSAGPTIDVRRAPDRFDTRLSWLDSRHSFSFGQHFDPTNTHHGLLLVNNEDTVLPGTGFETHPHRDMEIVTWVLQGSLVHEDSMGYSGVIYPALAQRMSAGTGILHSEKNDSWRLQGSEHRDPVHFIQMWIAPDAGGITPGYEQQDIDPIRLTNEWVTVASGMKAHAQDTAIRIANKDAALHATRLEAGHTVTMPDAPWAHLYVSCGSVEVEGVGALGQGDAIRFAGTGGQTIRAMEPAEILVWEMHAQLSA